MEKVKLVGTPTRLDDFTPSRFVEQAGDFATFIESKAIVRRFPAIVQHNSFRHAVRHSHVHLSKPYRLITKTRYRRDMNVSSHLACCLFCSFIRS
ncbi:hypothetical protein D3C75_986340 [compost metagenome]